MNPQIEQLNEQIANLTARLSALEGKFNFEGNNIEEFIRDIVFFDQDTTTNPGATTAVVTGVNFVSQTVTTTNLVTKTPAKFLKVFYKGQQYEIPVYTIT